MLDFYKYASPKQISSHQLTALNRKLFSTALMVETSVPVKEAIFSRNDIVISVDELDGAISKLDRNKACCYDQIYAELLQLFSKGVAETGVGWHTFPMQLQL